MFTSIQPHEFSRNKGLLEASFRLRKRVFHDQLGWRVPVHADQEKDSYDAAGASYLVWCSDDRKELYGLVRLMPTTGPTLLHDVFHETFPNKAELCRRGVWEGTRMCIDEAAISRDFPGISCKRAYRLLVLALCEAALAHGITRLVANIDRRMSCLYRRLSLTCTQHGYGDHYGHDRVYCASFPVNQETLASLRVKLNVHQPLFVPSRGFVAFEQQPEFA